jgi:hypothetical protein
VSNNRVVLSAKLGNVWNKTFVLRVVTFARYEGKSTNQYTTSWSCPRFRNTACCAGMAGSLRFYYFSACTRVSAYRTLPQFTLKALPCYQCVRVNLSGSSCLAQQPICISNTSESCFHIGITAHIVGSLSTCKHTFL